MKKSLRMLSLKGQRVGAVTLGVVAVVLLLMAATKRAQVEELWDQWAVKESLRLLNKLQQLLVNRVRFNLNS